MKVGKINYNQNFVLNKGNFNLEKNLANPLNKVNPALFTAAASLGAVAMSIANVVKHNPLQDKLEKFGFKETEAKDLIAARNLREPLVNINNIKVLSVFKKEANEYIDYIMKNPEDINCITEGKNKDDISYYQIKTNTSSGTILKDNNGKTIQLECTYKTDENYSSVKIVDTLNSDNKTFDRKIILFTGLDQTKLEAQGITDHLQLTPDTNIDMHKLFIQNSEQGKLDDEENKHFSKEHIKEKLENFGYKLTDDNKFKKYFPIEDYRKSKEEYGKLAADYRRMFNHNVSKREICDFQNFLLANTKETKHLYNKNFNELFTAFSIMYQSGCYEDIMNIANDMENPNKDVIKLITNIVENNPNKETLESFSYLKNLACNDIGKEIQSSLREKSINKDFEIREEIQKHIDTMSKYIDSQEVPDTLTLYRGENCEFLKNFKLNFNDIETNLGTLMEESTKTEHQDMIDDIIYFIKKEQPVISQETFMSTTLSKEKAIHNAKNDGKNDVQVLWKFKLAPKTKGVYADGMIANYDTTGKSEIIMQKGSNIKLTNINYDEKHKCWNIEAELSN